MTAREAVYARAGATALRRVEISRPVRLALELGVIRPHDDVFDYGCGYGADVEFLRERGHRANGWDPHHRPATEPSPAAVVNLGYVLNVIEDPTERLVALNRAWTLASRALIVAVRTTNDLRSIANGIDHGDGLLTGADTFQKLYGQNEAATYITDSVGVQPVPLGVGIFVAFKSEAGEQEWVDSRAALRSRSRRHNRVGPNRETRRHRIYQEHRELLRPLEEFVAEHGRIPATLERDWTVAVVEALGSLPKAFQVIRHAASEPWWDAAAADRRNELAVRFALARLRKRPNFSALPSSVQRDIKALFGSYKTACAHADDLLFSIGQPDVIRRAAAEASIGKVTPEAIYVHVDAVDLLPPELRVFFGAAEAVAGEVPSATLAKAHFDKPRVSWLVYPRFDTEPHPVLRESWVVDFRKLDVRPYDYSSRDNPPVLHRKELFVAPDHPRYDMFRRLTEQEERHGLLRDGLTLGTRAAWQQRLADEGWQLRGHRLVRSRKSALSE